MRAFGRTRFATVLAIWLVPELLGALLEPQRAGDRAARRDRGSGAAVVLGTTAAATLALACSEGLPRAAFPAGALRPAAAAGDALVVFGTLVRWVSIHSLGRSFTRYVTVRDDHAIVERGPYRYVRHPSYTGVFLSFAGFGLGLGNSAGLAAIALALWPAFAYRVSVEEAALGDRLGEPYAAYRARTKRFVPFVC